MALLRKDRKFLGRSRKPEDLEIVGAEGSRLRDARGRTLIDFQSGWSVGNLGWNHPAIVERVRRFHGPSYVLPHHEYAPWAELAEKLVDLSPGKLARAYRTVSGTEAVELALLLAMTHTGRHKVVSIEEAYHGNSFGARSIGADDVDAHLQGFKKLAPPLDAKALDRLETMLKHRDVAAFIFEPVITNLNVMIADDEFMAGVVDLCHRFGTLVIADEVATGFGRTGALWASEHYDLAPDIMCLGKALGGGLMPISSTLATADIARSAEDELQFYSTYGWMPLATEAALATVDIWRNERDELLANVGDRSDQIHARLQQIEWDVDEPEFRVKGLAIAVGLGDEDYVSKIYKRCRDKGLLVYEEDEDLVLMPALTIDENTVDKAMDILQDAAEK